MIRLPFLIAVFFLLPAIGAYAQTTKMPCPVKEGDDRCGVTTFDLVLITKHILGVQLLDSPYKMIAADANKSAMVTTFDLVTIRELILFINPNFPNNTSWRFIEAGYTFPNPSNPWAAPFPECKNVDLALQNAALDIDFVAVKVGDVNNSANPCTNLTGGGVGDRGQIARLYVEPDKALPIRAGETVALKFRLDSPEDLVAWQMGLQFDPEVLRFEEALPDYLERFSPFKNLGATEAGQGRLRLLWYAEGTKPHAFGSSEDIFTLKFETLRSVEDLQSALALNDGVLSVAGYREDGTALSIEMAIRNSTDALKAGNSLSEKLRVTAVPNPFRDELRLLIFVPQDDWIEVSVYDVNGRLVSTWNGETSDRQKEVLFQHTKNWGEGVFTYRVRTARHSVTGKIARQ